MLRIEKITVAGTEVYGVRLAFGPVKGVVFHCRDDSNNVVVVEGRDIFSHSYVGQQRHDNIMRYVVWRSIDYALSEVLDYVGCSARSSEDSVVSFDGINLDMFIYDDLPYSNVCQLILAVKFGKLKYHLDESDTGMLHLYFNGKTYDYKILDVKKYNTVLSKAALLGI